MGVTRRDVVARRYSEGYTNATVSALYREIWSNLHVSQKYKQHKLVMKKWWNLKSPLGECLKVVKEPYKAVNSWGKKATIFLSTTPSETIFRPRPPCFPYPHLFIYRDAKI